MSKDFPSGDGNLSLFGGAGPLRWPERQLSPRTGSMSPSKSAITQWGWGFHTVRGGIDPSDLCFCTGVIELKRYGGISHPEISPYPPWMRRDLDVVSRGKSRRALALRASRASWQSVGWDFYTVRGGIDPGDHLCRPQVIGVVEVWKHFSSRDGNLPRVRRDCNVDQRGNSRRWLHEPHPIANKPVGLAFPNAVGRYRPRGLRFCPRVVGVVELLTDS